MDRLDVLVAVGGQSQFGQLCPTGLHQQDVGRLHAAMDLAAAVPGRQSVGRRANQPDGLRDRHRPVLFDRAAEAVGVDVLGQAEVQSLVFANLEDFDQVGVFQTHPQPGLEVEPLEAVGMRSELRRQGLQRHHPSLGRLGLEDRGRTPLERQRRQLARAQQQGADGIANLDVAGGGCRARGQRRRRGTRGGFQRRVEQRRCFRRNTAGRRLRGGSQLPIVVRLLARIEKARPGGGQFVEQLLREFRVLPQGVAPHVGHLPGSRVANDLRVFLEPLRAEQAIVVGRLLGRWNGQPPVVRIEFRRHQDFSTLRGHPTGPQIGAVHFRRTGR